MDKIIMCTGSYDGNIAVWDMDNFRVVKTLALPSQQLAVRLASSSDKGDMAAALTSSVKLYDLNVPSVPIKNSYEGFTGNVMAVGF
jgi:hypothetical protein